MQLDDLRQDWLNPTEWTAPINSGQLEKLLASRPGLVEKMRRSVRWEIALTAVVVLALPFALLLVNELIYKIYDLLMVFLSLGLLFFYYRMMAMLNQMRLVEGNVRGHLQRLAAGLRAMLRFYYRLTLAMGPLVLVLNFCYYLGKELARPGPFRWQMLAIVGGLLLVMGALLQVLAVYATRWYLQRLYGQHLDRLEANLRELGDETPAPQP